VGIVVVGYSDPTLGDRGRAAQQAEPARETAREESLLATSSEPTPAQAAVEAPEDAGSQEQSRLLAGVWDTYNQTKSWIPRWTGLRMAIDYAEYQVTAPGAYAQEARARGSGPLSAMVQGMVMAKVEGLLPGLPAARQSGDDAALAYDNAQKCGDSKLWSAYQAGGVAAGEQVGVVSLTNAWHREQLLTCRRLSLAESFEEGVCGGQQVVGTALVVMGVVRSLPARSVPATAPARPSASVRLPAALDAAEGPGVGLRGGPNKPARVTINRQTGLTFQGQVTNALGAEPAGAMTGSTLSGAPYTTIPDGVLPNGVILEIKGRQYICNIPQLQAQISMGQAPGGPGNMLVVGPGCTVWQPVIDAFGHSAATPRIYRFNPATGALTPYP